MNDNKNMELQAAQSNADLMEMMDLIAGAIEERGEQVKTQEHTIDSVGRETLDLHKSAMEASEILHQHSDLLDQVAQSQEQVEQDNAQKSQALEAVAETAKAVAERLGHMDEKTTQQIQELNDNHQETITLLSNLSQASKENADSVTAKLESSLKDLKELDHSEEIESIKDNLSDLVKAMLDSDQQNKVKDKKWSDEMDKIQKSFNDAIENTNQVAAKAGRVTDKLSNVEGSLDKIDMKLNAILTSAGVKLDASKVQGKTQGARK